MSGLDILIVCIIAVAFLTILYFILERRPQKIDPQTQNMVSLVNDLRKEIQQSFDSQKKEVQGKLENMGDNLVKNLVESSSTLQKHFSNTTQVIREITEKMTKLDETNKQVLNFSEQLQSLEKILKNPKQRGILGEYWLDTLLGQVLQPTQYKMQYDLGADENGTKLIPDAVIFLNDLIIPIDAKFSLEGYNRIQQENDTLRRGDLEKAFKSDVKKRIDETAKYVRPEKGTTNFAFMFIPAEGVYHNLIIDNVGSVQVNTRNLIEYAFEKKVVIVSPTSFFAYLQTVIMGLKALQIEASVKEIQKQAEQMIRHLKAYEEYHNKLGRNLETTYRAYTDSSKELKKIDKDIFKITAGTTSETQLLPIDIDRPQIEE